MDTASALCFGIFLQVLHDVAMALQDISLDPWSKWNKHPTEDKMSLVKKKKKKKPSKHLQ